MLIKNLPKYHLFQTLFIRYLLDIIALKRALFSGKFIEAKAIYTAHLSLVKEIPKLLQKRSLNTITTSEMTRGTTDISNVYKRPFLIWEFFIKKKRFFSEIQK